MKLAIRILLVAIAVPTVFFAHLYGVFFVGGLFPKFEHAFEWPILGLALISFIAITTLAIAAIFRVKAK